MVHDLYEETIIDHSKRPRNCHAMDNANHKAEGFNPLCGDKLKLYLRMEGDIVKDVSFVGSGCAISTASASLMTESLRGKTRAESLALLDKFHDLLTTDSPVTKDLGKTWELLTSKGKEHFGGYFHPSHPGWIYLTLTEGA